MIPEFKELDEKERQLLFKAPVLVSVLACCSDNKVNKKQMAEAIRLAHLKTFTAKPALLSYYQEVDKVFKEEFEAAIQKYCPFDETHREQLQQEVNRIHRILERLDKGYADTLSRSLDAYADHVKRADHSILQDFLFAFTIPGLSA